ncbi:MAG: hypothetical protein EZS28_032763, partial [Streblomastix strix]
CTTQFDLEEEEQIIDNIPADDVLSMTGVLLCCYYHDQQFFQNGYYLNIRQTDLILLLNLNEV